MFFLYVFVLIVMEDMESGEKEKTEKKKCVCAQKKWLGFNYQC